MSGSVQPLSSSNIMKAIQSFLQRASETREKEPLISYHCQMYAAQLALNHPERKQTANMDIFLNELINRLDQEKNELSKHHTYGAILKNQDACYEYLSKFALKVFLLADQEDRHGKATLKTARIFLASMCFFEVLKLLNVDELESLDIQEKIKYAKWRAAEIGKSIRTGESIRPPLVSESDNNSIESEGKHKDTFIESQASSKLSIEQSISPTILSISPTTTLKLKRLDDVQKLAKYASNSLQYEDILSAKKFLQEALDILNILE